MGVLLGETAGCGIVIAGTEIVRTGFLVVVLCAVAERVGIILVRVVLVAEGVVLVGLGAAFCYLPSGGGEPRLQKKNSNFTWLFLHAFFKLVYHLLQYCLIRQKLKTKKLIVITPANLSTNTHFPEF